MDQTLSLRRLRQSKLTRDLVIETTVSVSQLIQPLFVVEGLAERQEIPGLSRVYRDNTMTLKKQIESDLELGVEHFLLFGVPKDKNLNFDFTVNQIAEIKKTFGDSVWLSVDVCLCSSTNHGHCGILNDSMDHVTNSSSVAKLSEQAKCFAQAGADCVAPSDMMDGRVAGIRQTLNESGFERTLIMSYSAKFSSQFYGPFRIAADSAPKNEIKLKDRATYQIDSRRYSDALLSSQRDAQEGADILMVKPGLPYLDVLYRLKQEIPKPWAVYQVSGEYAAIELLAREGLCQGPSTHLESWTALRRAGADIIITYGARHAREWLRGNI